MIGYEGPVWMIVFIRSKPTNNHNVNIGREHSLIWWRGPFLIHEPTFSMNTHAP